MVFVFCVVDCCLQEFQVLIAPLGAEGFTVIVKLTDTTGSLKATINDMKGLDANSYELIYKQKKLDNHFTLRAYYFEPNCKIHLVQQ